MKLTCNKMKNIKIISSFDIVLINVHVLSIDDCFSIIKLLVISIHGSFSALINDH